MSSPVEPSSPVAALARLSDRTVRPRSRALERITLDTGRHIARLHPRELAAVYAAPMLSVDLDLYREGQALLARPRDSSEAPRALNLLDVADRLAEALRALQVETFTPASLAEDLVIYARHGDRESVRAYLLDVARAVRAEVPVWVDPAEEAERQARRAARMAPKPKPEPKRRPVPKTSAQRRQANTERMRAARVPAAQDVTIAAAACMVWREGATPGAHPAREVHDWYGARAANTASHTPVGRNRFYRIADEVCGPRQRRASGPVYVVRQEVAPMDREQRRELAALIVDKLTAEWREYALDGLADLVADRQAERTAEASTPAPRTATAGRAHVVDLAAHRRRHRVA